MGLEPMLLRTRTLIWRLNQLGHLTMSNTLILFILASAAKTNQKITVRGIDYDQLPNIIFQAGHVASVLTRFYYSTFPLVMHR